MAGRYEYLRAGLSKRLVESRCSKIDHALGPELAEGLDDIARAARAALPYVQKAAPAILQGAATGFLTGGPMGAVAGATAGGLSTLGAKPAAPAPPVSNPAALQLLMTILRPEIVDALIAMGLGKQGATQVAVAGTPVPVAAVPNLIQSLAEDALAAHHAIARDSGTPRYLADAIARGEDVAMPHVRAGALHSLIREAWDDDSYQDEIDDEAEQIDLDDIDQLGGLDP